MPSATTTIATIMTSVVNTTVEFITSLFVDFWPWILGVSVLIGLIALFYRLGTGVFHTKK
jgi:F0F1-type ATP synthase assembly protein I